MSYKIVSQRIWRDMFLWVEFLRNVEGVTSTEGIASVKGEGSHYLVFTELMEIYIFWIH